MASYQFFVRKPDGSRHLACEQFCADAAAAWRVVEDISRGAGEQAEGGIYVKNDRDEVVILVGMASARVLTGQKSRQAAPRLAPRTRTA